MFAFKFLLPTFYLVVISIINYVCASPDPEAVKECQEIISEQWFFKESDDDAIHNFHSAFQLLTIQQIENNFMPPAGGYETDEEKQRREIKKFVTKMYYLDFIANNYISPDLMKTPNQWCQERLKQIKFDPKINKNEEERMIDCLEFTNKLLRDDKYEIYPKIILHYLYYDWSTRDLRRLKSNVPDQYFDSLSAWNTYKNRYTYNVENYSEKYFEYYTELIKNLSPTQGDFRSIKQFCEYVGHVFVKGSVRDPPTDYLLNF